MNAVGATTDTTTSATNPPTTSPPASAAEPPSLLTEPVPAALATTDPLSMLYLFESKDEALGVDEATKKIAAFQNERHLALQQEQQAIAQASEAAKQHSFWDDLGGICAEVAKVAAVVASVAAAVATLGAATPIAALAIAGAVLSSASFADGEFHVLRSLGVDDKTAGLIDTGMSIGGAVLSCGAGFVSGGQAASSTLSTITRASGVVTGVAGIGHGAAAIEVGEAQARSDQAAADETAATARSDHAQRLIQIVIDQTQNSDQQSQHITRTIANTKTIENETALTAATAVRG